MKGVKKGEGDLVRGQRIVRKGREGIEEKRGLSKHKGLKRFL